jgi:hypothetical protein
MPQNGLTRAQVEAATDASTVARAATDVLGALALQETLHALLKDEKNWVVYKDTKDANGQETRIGYRGKTAVYVKDSSGEWDSKDGTNWVLKGSNNHRFWHGTVEVDANQNYRTQNLDSGVTNSFNKDGTRTRKITGTAGATVEIISDSNGVSTQCSDASGTWTSKDGTNWTNAKTGTTYTGELNIDRFGRYIEKANGIESVSLRSRELDLVLKRQAEITKAYSAVFPEPGDIVRYSQKDYPTRPPTLAELDCIDKVCAQNKQMDLKDLRFAFVEGSKETDDLWLYGAYQYSGNGGKGQMLLFPNSDRVTGWTGLEGTLQHELVHHEQHQAWGETQWGAATAPAGAKQVMRDLGWAYDATTVRNHILDNKHREFRYNFDSYKWEPMVGGNVDPDPKNALTSAQMRDIAKVKPVTNYFTEPWEMHAEALSLYRFDRHQLWSQSQDMYTLMKKYDQAEIDRRYGQDKGTPKFIRGAGCDVVPNTDANRKALQQIEEGWKTAPKPQQISERNQTHPPCSCREHDSNI